MKEQLVDRLLSMLDSMPQEWIVLIISSFPILELRGALPLAMSVYDMPFWKAYILSVLGNMLPVIPLLLLFQPISTWLRRYSWYAKLYAWLYQSTVRKSESVQKYGAIGLMLFTAVPIPTTGAWTASVAACIFSLRFSYAFLSIFAGVLIAGVLVGLIMGVFTYSFS